MKKKILSFILAICLIIPCAFMMTACGQKPLDLAGKTIMIHKVTDMGPGGRMTIFYRDAANDNKEYSFSYDSGNEDIFENAVCVNIMKQLAELSNEATIDELKTKLKTMALTEITDESYVLKFNDNASKVDFYKYSAGNFETIVNTFDVNVISHDINFYRLKKDGEETHDVIEARAKDNISVFGPNFESQVSFAINNMDIEVTVTPTNGVGESKTVLLSDCEAGGLSFPLISYIYKVFE